MSNPSTRKRYNISTVRGDTFERAIEFYDDCDGSPVDLVAIGAEFKAEVRDGETDLDDLIISFTGTDFVIGGDDNNRVTIKKSAGDMTVDAGDYFWDVEMTNTTSGTKTTILYGDFFVCADITTQ